MNESPGSKISINGRSKLWLFLAICGATWLTFSLRLLVDLHQNALSTKQGTTKDLDYKTDENIFEQTHPSAMENLNNGNSFAVLKNWHDAHKCWAASIQLIGHDIGCGKTCAYDARYSSLLYGMIAISLSEQSKFEDALKHLTEAEKLDLTMKENFIVEANIWEHIGDRVRATAARVKAERCKPRNDYPAWTQNNQFLK